jgi:hypothetical protein
MVVLFLCIVPCNFQALDWVHVGTPINVIMYHVSSECGNKSHVVVPLPCN